MPSNKKASDDELIAAYRRLNSVWKVADEFGMCGQSVHERLAKLGATNPREEEFTAPQRQLITDAYLNGFLSGDGVLDRLVALTGKSKQNICRWAKRQGLTNHKRKDSPEVAAERGERAKRYIRKFGHPRGALGHKHSPETLDKIAAASKRNWEMTPPGERAARILKSLKTREANGTLYPARPCTTWKAGWRVVGTKRAYFRSRWEANYGRYLEFLKSLKHIKDWEHEPETFWFEKIKRGTRSYLPDFRVTRNNGSIYYVEVKGYMDQKSKTKIKRMAKYYPNVELEVVASKEYKSLAQTSSRIVPGWE